MSKIAKTIDAMICGIAFGVVLGPFSRVMVDLSDVLMRGWAWPKIDTEYILIALLTSLPAAINGAIGAGFSAGCGRRKRRDITWLPALIHVVAFIASLIFEIDFLFLQMVALMFTVIIWPVGRMGQWIGAVISRASSEQSPKIG